MFSKSLLLSKKLNKLQIKVSNVLYFFPTEVIEEEIRRVEIHRATEEAKQGKSASLIKAVDREFGVEEENCHVSSGARGNSWLSFEIAWSFITHVNILVPNTAGTFPFFQVDFKLFRE